MNPYAVLPFICGLIFLAFGLFIYSKNTKSRLNVFYFLTCLTSATWVLGYSFMYASQDEYHALIYARLGYAGVVFIPTFLYCFIVKFLQLTRKKSIIISMYMISFFFLFADTTKYFLNGMYEYFWGFYPKVGFLYIFYVLFFAMVFVRCSWLLFEHLKINKSNAAARNQIKYVLLAFVVGMSSIVDYLPNYKIEIYPWGYISALGWIILMAIAIFKYRLMDINIALTRAGIFLVVYTLVLGIPYWLGYATKSWLFSTTLAILLASIGPFIYNYIRGRAENIILKEQRRYQNTLRQLSSTLTLIKDLDRLLKIIVFRVAKTVRVQFACAYLFQNNKFIQKSFYVKSGVVIPDLPQEITPESEMVSLVAKKHKPVFLEDMSQAFQSSSNLKNSLLIPSFMRGKLLGFLFLGPKLSGTVYTKDDAAVFEILANQAALAIENTEFIEESQKTQAQLFSAERMASMGAMAGGMSHQINNRFHAIIMATSDTIDVQNFINVESYPKEARDYCAQVKYALGRIQENAKHGGKIVNDFLNFSQPDRLQKQAHEFDLAEPLHRAIEMVRIKTSFPEDTIEISGQDGLPKIQGDFVLLQDVFFNLVDNAVDAIKSKELLGVAGYKGKITVAMSQKDSKIVIIMRDNGTGISEESLKKVFVPFFTTKATSSKGTGLGLFVIQKIINAHQGDIKLESKYGDGTVFTITLPIIQKETR